MIVELLQLNTLSYLQVITHSELFVLLILYLVTAFKIRSCYEDGNTNT